MERKNILGVINVVNESENYKTEWRRSDGVP